MSANAQTKKSSRFGESVKKTGSKAKAYAGKKVDSVKSYARGYRGDLSKAYDLGYQRGWEEAHTIPNRLGAKTAAAYGYKKGVRNRKKSDKYIAQYNKGRG